MKTSSADPDDTLRVLRGLVDPRDPSVTPRARVVTLLDAYARVVAGIATLRSIISLTCGRIQATTYARDEYVRGFTDGISVAWCLLRWATAATPQVPRKDLGTWARGKIAEAYRRAGIEMPEKGREP